ncbi:MAG TPA: HAD family hydrolase, partial [Pseudomonas sp.]|nr:HAD family hydrolase [Pseudomonas sp.]
GMTAIAIPDAAMADEKYVHADGILRTLTAFRPSAFGLPALEWA